MTAISDRLVEANSAPRWKALQLAGAVYAAGTAIHTIDHLRRGPDSVSAEVRELGVFFTLAAAVVVTLIFTRHRLAPLFAVVIGFSHGLGIVTLHWLPDWGVASDSFLTDGAALVSWVAVAVEVAGAFAVGLAGLTMLKSPSQARHFAWLIGLVVVVSFVPKGTAAVLGADWDSVSVLVGFIAVFGALALAARLAPPEWTLPRVRAPEAAVAGGTGQ